MRKGNDILPTLHLLRRGNKVERFNYTLRGKKRVLFFFLQLLSVVFGWGVLVYCAYILFVK
jgi:hypothetical protein